MFRASITNIGAPNLSLCGYSINSHEDRRLIIDRQRKGWSSKMFDPTDKVLKQSVYDSNRFRGGIIIWEH